MNKATLEITSCKQCPYCHIGMSYSLDGFDVGNDWECSHQGRIIESFVEWKMPLIPQWCQFSGDFDKALKNKREVKRNRTWDK